MGVMKEKVQSKSCNKQTDTFKVLNWTLHWLVVLMSLGKIIKPWTLIKLWSRNLIIIFQLFYRKSFPVHSNICARLDISLRTEIVTKLVGNLWSKFSNWFVDKKKFQMEKLRFFTLVKFSNKNVHCTWTIKWQIDWYIN